jgi:hypothetical protein
MLVQDVHRLVTCPCKTLHAGVHIDFSIPDGGTWSLNVGTPEHAYLVHCWDSRHAVAGGVRAVSTACLCDCLLGRRGTEKAVSQEEHWCSIVVLRLLPLNEYSHRDVLMCALVVITILGIAVLLPAAWQRVCFVTHTWITC